MSVNLLDRKEPTVNFHYGFTIVNPTMATKIIMPEMTWRDVVRALLDEVWYITVQSALLAGSITSFAWGFGLIGK